jgi:carbonic anhydrase
MTRDNADELLAHNARYVETHPADHLDVAPARKLAVVTCMDSRLDVFGALGLQLGEAHVIRNGGGVVSDDVIRSLAISQRKLGTEEVILIQHTDCGMLKITDDGFRQELQDATGIAPPFAIESFRDLEANVRQSLERLRNSPFLAHRDHIRGFVYDVDTGALREVS